MREGRRLALTLTTFLDRPELPLVAAALQEEMRQIGIAVRVVIGNSSDIPAGHRSGALEMGLVARNFGTRWLATIFGLVFLGHQIGGFTGAFLGGLVFDRRGFRHSRQGDAGSGLDGSGR